MRNALLGQHKFRICLAGLCFTLQALGSVSVPAVIFALLRWAEQSDAPISDGAWLVVAMAFCSITSVIGRQSFVDVSFAVGLSARSSVSGAIFRKCLRLGTSELKGSSIGEVTMFISSDVIQLSEFFSAVLGLFLQPFEVIALLCLLWSFVGPATIGALVVTAFSMTVSAYVSDLLDKASMQRAALAEQRMQLLTEVIAGIKVVKLNACRSSLRLASTHYAAKSVASRAVWGVCSRFLCSRAKRSSMALHW